MSVSSSGASSLATDRSPARVLGDAIVGAMPELDAHGRSVALALYRLLLGGAPVAVEELAWHANLGVSRVATILDDWNGVYRDGEGRIVGFWGLALRDMAHRLTIDGVELCAWCAYDPLFIVPLVGRPGRVSSKDPVTGETVTVTVTAEGVRDLSPERAVVSFPVPDGPWDDTVIQTFCHHVLFFASPESGRRWLDEHPGGLLLPVGEAFEVGRRVNREVFRRG